MRILENHHVRSSPHSVRSSTEWGVSTSEARVVGRGRPLVECAGRAGRSRAPAAALRAGLRPPWTVRPVPGPGWLSGGPSLVSSVRRSGAVWVGRSTEQVWGHPRVPGGRFQIAPSAPPGTSRPRTPGHRLRAAEEQPHPPAPPQRGLRPGRLPHRPRQAAGHLPPGTGQRGLARPLPDLLAHCGPADRGAVHQEPVPPLPGPHSVHQHRRQRPHRGIPPTRTPRPATPRSHRATDARVEGPLRGPLRSGGHGQRVRSRTRHATLPLPRTGKGPHPARPDGHRRQYRATQRTDTGRGTSHPPQTNCFPGLPRPA